MIDEKRVHAALRETFGHETFRPAQLDVIQRVLAGEPTLAVMPTGAGKSLCYQLPAVLLEGVTLVVSPLLALMRDQVDALASRGVRAAFVNSSQSDATRNEVEARLAQGRLQLVYVAPERFRSASFMRALACTKVSLVAVDEAHCISEWGHAFRPDYERLGEVCAVIAPPRLLAMTATASPDVRQDIIRSLRMRHPHVAVAGFDRPNLHLEVHALAKESEKRDTLLAAVRTASPAIVYAATRRHATELARFLQSQKLRAGAYHAGLPTEERERTQQAFARGEIDVVTATNAFGLGVDKQDVRLVVHADLPRSLEAYYQEVGRAGRDGLPASGLLLFSERDIALQQQLLKLAHPAPALVSAIFERARRSVRPLSASELVPSARGSLAAERTAAVAYLESLGLIERRRGAPSLALELVGETTPHGDGLKSALARLLGGRKGIVTMGAAARALGAHTQRELHGLLAPLEVAGELRRRELEGHVAYGVPAEASLTAEHLRRLRMRGARDRARLLQLVDLARRSACRRHALLRALGEQEPPRSCPACDACVGSRFAPVRSQIEHARRGLRPEAMSDLSAMVPGLSTARSGLAPNPSRAEAHKDRPRGEQEMSWQE